MKRFNWGRDRRLIQVGIWLVLAFVIYRWFTPGIPVLRGPSVTPAAYVEGKTLFLHKWRENDPLAHGDGLGPVFNDTSCAACHNQGGVGGGGGGQHNVNTFSLFPGSRESHVVVGLVHAHAVNPAFQESTQQVDRLFPGVIKRSINSTALFGDGWIDRISERAIRFEENKQGIVSAGKEVVGTVTVGAGGRARVLSDGRLGKFGWKAQFATLDEFVAAACANEVGLGSAMMEQATPLGQNATNTRADLDAGQFAALAGFVRGLPRPESVMPIKFSDVETVERGRLVFDSVGCAICHVPDLGGVQGVYSDLLLHVIKDPGPETGAGTGGDLGYGWSIRSEATSLPLDAPAEMEWRTPPLWGVADSAPYFHDGESPTLEAAILRHGGDAIHVTRKYKRMDLPSKLALLAFLQTLRAPAEPDPANATPAAARVAAQK